MASFTTFFVFLSTNLVASPWVKGPQKDINGSNKEVICITKLTYIHIFLFRACHLTVWRFHCLGCLRQVRHMSPSPEPGVSRVSESLILTSDVFGQTLTCCDSTEACKWLTNLFDRPRWITTIQLRHHSKQSRISDASKLSSTDYLLATIASFQASQIYLTYQGCQIFSKLFWEFQSLCSGENFRP